MCIDFEAGSYVRLIDSCTTQLKAQGPSRNCDESQKEEEQLAEKDREIQRLRAADHEAMRVRSQMNTNDNEQESMVSITINKNQ